MCSVERLAPHGAGQLTVCPSVAVAEQLSNAIAWLPSVALAWLVLDASPKLSLVALAVLFSLATAVLPFSATAWEVESDEQMLVPFCTLTVPLLLTHTSPPWAWATPDRAKAEASINATVTNMMTRFIDTTLSSVGRRKGVSDPAPLTNAGSITRLARCGVYPN
jgi:hypothetical protein